MDKADLEKFKIHILSVVLEKNAEQKRRTDAQIAAVRDEMKEELDAVTRLWSRTRRGEAENLAEMRHGGAGGDAGERRQGRRKEKEQRRGGDHEEEEEEEEEEGVQVERKMQERRSAESHQSAGAVEKTQAGANKQGLLLLQLLSKSQNHIRRHLSKLPWNKTSNHEEPYRYVKYENDEMLQKGEKVSILEKWKRQLAARKKSWEVEKRKTEGEEIEEEVCNVESRGDVGSRREKKAEKIKMKEEEGRGKKEEGKEMCPLRDKRKKRRKVKEKKKKSQDEKYEWKREMEEEEEGTGHDEEKKKKRGSSKAGDWGSVSTSSGDSWKLKEIKNLLSKKNEVGKKESEIISHLINECEAEILKFEIEILKKSKKEGQSAGGGGDISDTDVGSDLDGECENFRKMFTHE